MSASIRRRLLTRALAGTSVVLLLSCVGVYVLVRHGWIRQFDHALVDHARAVALLCEADGDLIELDQVDMDLPEFGLRGRDAFQVWTLDGTFIAKSQSLGARELPFECPRSREPVISWLEGPLSHRARLVRVRFDAKPNDANPVSTTLAGVVAVAGDASEGVLALERLRIILALVWIASSAVLALVLSVSTREGLRPLRRIADEAEAMDSSALERPFALAQPVPAEVAPVVQALNGMLARLARAFAHERALVSDVAHELRTPLAGLRTTIDVALMSPDLPVRSREDLARCLAIVDDMRVMMENLLALARLDSGQGQLPCSR